MMTANATMTTTSTALEVRGIYMTFYGVDALADINLVLDRGEWLGLIGPNGSGKSTMLNVLSGLYTPRAGSVMLAGNDLGKMKARNRIKRGLSRTFQHPQLAQSLTILENAQIGATFAETKVDDVEKEAHKWLEELGCGEYAEHLPAEVPYGVQKLCEVARALVASPRVLLLDEPAAGLSAKERVELVSALRAVRQSLPDLTLCLVEHDVGLVASVCEQLAVLSAGKLIAQGVTQSVLADEAVKTAYLGTRSSI